MRKHSDPLGPYLTGAQAIHLLLFCLTAFLLVTYRYALSLPFVNDDYVFLDRVGHASFVDLWRPDGQAFLWYRPWSQEFHYWALLHLAGAYEPLYHLANFLLWLGIMTLYFALLRRFAGGLCAALATAFLAVLGMWAVPIIWVAGAQDLWMLLFALIALHFLARGKYIAVTVPLLLALLSKETAAAIPAVGAAYLLLIERQGVRQVVARMVPQGVVVAAWALFHPTLFRPSAYPALRLDPTLHPSWDVILTKTFLTQLNFESALAPWLSWPRVLWESGLSAAALLLFLYVIYRRSSPITHAHIRDSRKAILFGLVWTALGWIVLFVPSIGWHPYYGLFGSLGFCLAGAAVLVKQPRLAAIVILCLAFLRQAQAVTISSDWGMESHQVRAGAVLRQIRERLYTLHPTFPEHSRLFFAEIPARIGFLAGDGPSVRVWYRDSTLRALYFSAYRPLYTKRGGRDYFFIFDPNVVLREVQAGPESSGLAMRRTPSWVADHSALARMFLRCGNLAAAALEYEKLAVTIPTDPEWAIFAGTTYEAVGDSAEASRFRAAALSLVGSAAVTKWWPPLVQEARAFAQGNYIPPF